MTSPRIPESSSSGINNSEGFSPLAMAQDTQPLYVQIANELRAKIAQGIYQIGDQLPTEMALSAQFEVNRHTLRRAVERLRQEGLLRVDRGRGTFVAATPLSFSISERVRYNEFLMAQGLQPSKEVLQVAELSADEAIAQPLQLNPGDPVVMMERLELADGHPINLSSRYFPSALMPALATHCRQYQSISQMLQEQYNFDHRRRTTRISARTVQARDAHLLQVPLNSPVLLTESINENQHGQIIEYGVTRFRSDRMELVFENPASSP